ncbi:MAG TPA: MFS transporter [Chthoniobacterales bacterium]|nr:MFS transporter [Chthoniobacterales bacterium]
MSASETWIGRQALSLLRPGAFRRYIVGSAISDTGTWMQMMAQGWVVSGLTSSTFLLGLVTFFTGLPTLGLAPIGGSAADRFDKRKILIATQVAQTVFAVALGWLVLTNRIQIWEVMIFGALLGMVIAFEMPAMAALVPEIVKREEIAAAIGLDRTIFHGSRLIGASSGGLLIGAWGAASAFFCNAVSFVALIIALVSLPKRPIGSAEEEEQRKSGFSEGLRYVRSNRIIISMIMLIACNTIFVFPAISPAMLPLYVRNVLRLGPSQLGWLMAVSGTGAFLGAIGLLSVQRARRLKFMSGNVLAIAAGVFGMSRSHSFLFTAIAMGIIAIALSMNFGLANTIVQEHAPSHLRGRVSAVFGMSFFGLMPIGGLFVPGISDLIGMRTALAGAAVIYAALAVTVLSLAGRHVCDRPMAPISESEMAPAA